MTRKIVRLASADESGCNECGHTDPHFHDDETGAVIFADEELITACTRCGRDKAAVARHAPNTYGARCRHDVRGEHKWWTGTLRQWFVR